MPFPGRNGKKHPLQKKQAQSSKTLTRVPMQKPTDQNQSETKKSQKANSAPVMAEPPR
jgi:hypothetical protein